MRLIYAVFILLLVLMPSAQCQETSATIGSFVVSANPIKAGDSTTLSWYVWGSGNQIVSIDHGIGNVDYVGTRDISPGQSTVYTLTATDYGKSVTAQAKCLVEPIQPTEQTLWDIISEGGNVWAGNWNYGKQIGDDDENNGYQAFLSFDISDIPPGSIIRNVVFNFGDSIRIVGDPFNNLGYMRAYPIDYGSHINSGDYILSDSTEAVLKIGSEGELKNITVPPEFYTALQEKLGNSRFQLRLQFDKESNDDGKPDFVEPGSDVRMTVEFSPGQQTGAGATVCSTPLCNGQCCPQDTSCVNGQCTTPPVCSTPLCNGQCCPAGQHCVNGQCTPSCPTPCPAGQPLNYVQCCPAGQHCVNGQCKT
jgi:hypothetical protein